MQFDIFLVKTNIFIVLKKLLCLSFLLFSDSIDIFLLFCCSFRIIMNQILMNPAIISSIIPIIVDVILNLILRVFC